MPGGVWRIRAARPCRWTVDFDTLCTTLREVEYAGPVVFESFSSAVVHPTLSNQLAVWRNLWDDGEELARHAYGFMMQRLRA